MEKKGGGAIPFYQRKEFLPLAVFGGLLFILILSTGLSGHPPTIDNVSQQDSLTCEIVTIEGGNFGPQDSGGEVRIGDLALTPSNYLKWSNEKIVASIPRDVSSGIIYVVTKNGKCRGDIYINPDEIPKLASWRGPLIKSLTPENTSPGRIITIRGERFGDKRGASVVSFSQAALKPGEQEQSALLVAARDEEYEYAAWNDSEIQVRVPDNARSGKMVVTTSQGTSNPRNITIISTVGRKQYEDMAGYTVRSQVQITDISAISPNRLFLWVPMPQELPEQRKIERKNLSPPPIDSTHQNILLFKFEDLSDARDESVNIKVTLDRYAITTQIDPSLIRTDYQRDGAFYRALTGDDRFIKPSHPAVSALLWRACGDEKNPYLKARKVYDFLQAEFSFDAISPEHFDWYSIIAGKKGDALVYASLFTALLRASGVPARLVAGVLVNESMRSRRHYWSEFYIMDFGWVPVDPLLGSGKTYASFPSRPDAREYYFGNLDNRHITFSNTVLEWEKQTPQGRTVFQKNAPGLQSFHEEASGALSRYTAVWNDPVVEPLVR